MKKLLKSLAVASLAAAVLSGCMSTSVTQNEAYKFPLAVSTTAPALIFPISLHGVPGNTKDVGLAISAGVVADRGLSVISAQQLYDHVGNLSWTVGENMRRQVKSGNLKLTGSAAGVAKDLASSVSLLTDGLKAVGAIKDKSYAFDKVIVLHVDSAGGLEIPGTTKVTAFGGVVDIQKQEVVSYIEKDLILAEDKDAILAQMPVEMNAIIDELIADK